MHPQPRITLATADNPGAVAVVQLIGAGVEPLLSRATGSDEWPAATMRLVDLAGVDQGMAVLLRAGEDGWAQLMPHGGPRVVQRLLDRLIEMGAVYEPDPLARLLYPEARSDLEADMLAAIARAASPAAIDLLAAQPKLWSAALASGKVEPAPGAVLDRLIDPPLVVVVGRPNVGKSTLSNRMLGRSASVVADLPGTTRDWVAGLAELDAVAVRWLDTPGLRLSTDPIERQAIALSANVVAAADVLIAMRDPQTDWPDPAALPRQPDVWVMNKVDDDAEGDGAVQSFGDGRDAQTPLAISALADRRIDNLQRRVLECLLLAPVPAEALWAFSPALRRALATGDGHALARYVNG